MDNYESGRREDHDERDVAPPHECSVCGSPLRNEYQEGRSCDSQDETCRPCAYRLARQRGASAEVLAALVTMIADEIVSGDIDQAADLVRALIDCGEMIGASRERKIGDETRKRMVLR